MFLFLLGMAFGIFFWAGAVFMYRHIYLLFKNQDDK